MSGSTDSSTIFQVVWKQRDGKRHGRHRHELTKAQARAYAHRLNEKHPSADHWVEPCRATGAQHAQG